MRRNLKWNIYHYGKETQEKKVKKEEKKKEKKKLQKS